MKAPSEVNSHPATVKKIPFSNNNNNNNNNKIPSIPPESLQMPHLEDIDLSKNNIKQLPRGIEVSQTLKQIKLKENPLESTFSQAISEGLSVLKELLKTKPQQTAASTFSQISQEAQEKRKERDIHIAIATAEKQTVSDTTSELNLWLHFQGFDRYWPLFERKGLVSLQGISKFASQDLLDLGIKDKNHVVQILVLLESYQRNLVSLFPLLC